MTVRVVCKHSAQSWETRPDGLWCEDCRSYVAMPPGPWKALMAFLEAPPTRFDWLLVLGLLVWKVNCG